MKLPRIACLLLLVGCQRAPTASDGATTGCPAGASGDWCWVRGRPLAVTGDRELGTAFAIGAEGSFLRWQQGAWAPARVPTPRTLTSGWVGGADSAWVSDDHGSAWRLDGATWTEAPAASPIARLIGTPSGAIWAVTTGQGEVHGGATGAALLRWEGGAWAQAMEPFKYCLGGDYLIARDGSAWSAGLTCDGGGAVAAVEVRRWDGAAWQLVGAPIPGQGWYPTLERAGDTIRVTATGAFAWDGAQWLSILPPERDYPQGLPASVTALWDGVRFSLVPRAIGCEGAFRLDEAHAWCFGSGRVFREQGALWVSTLTDPFADTLGAERWDQLPPALWAGGDTYRAWGAGPTEVFRVRTVAGSRPERYDGARWTAVLDVRASDVHGAGPDDVWFATEAGPVRYDGRSYLSLPIPVELASGELTGVYALGGGVALAVTDRALVEFRGAWRTLHAVPADWRIVSVAGSSPDDIWLVQVGAGRSDVAAVMHFDGAGWKQVPVSPLSGFGGPRLATRGGATWLATDGAVVRLGASAAPVPVDRLSLGADLWIGADALWLTTDRVARRHAW